MEKPGLSFSSENTSQKMFIGTDKISENVNDSDSDGGSFSELSDSDTCKVNPPAAAAAGAAVTARKRKLFSQCLTKARRE